MIPNLLGDITETEAGDKVFSELKAEKTKTTIPPNSKIRFSFETYSWTEIEVFNPSPKPQVFSLVQDDKVLVLMPKEWVESLSVESSYFYLVTGKLNISEETVSTPSDCGAIIELENGSQVSIKPNSKFKKEAFEKMIEKKEDSKWDQLLYSFYPSKVEAMSFWSSLQPRNKFQMKWPTSITGVRG